MCQILTISTNAPITLSFAMFSKIYIILWTIWKVAINVQIAIYGVWILILVYRLSKQIMTKMVSELKKSYSYFKLGSEY